MRPLNDKEFKDFKKYVKCGWLDCAYGMGLAGMGRCSAGGQWNQENCLEYILEAEYLAQWKVRDDAAKLEAVCAIAEEIL